MRAALRRHGRTSVAGVLVALAVAVLGRGSVALYDGLGFPDEPYRYVSAPADAPATKAPTSAQANGAMKAGRSTAWITASTAEQGPQAQLTIPPGNVSGPPSATKLDVSVTPRAGDSPLSGMTFDGNVYAVAAHADVAGALTTTPGSTSTSATYLRLRSIKAPPPAPAFVYRPDARTPWRALATTLSGQDGWVTPLIGFGDYALAYGVPGASQAVDTGDGSGRSLLVPALLLAALLVAIGVTIASIRLRRP